MAHNISTSRPWWFWVICAAYLIWSVIGCGMYLAERLLPADSYVEYFGQAMLGLREITPVWATAGYAIGVWFALAGIVLLILRKRAAVTIFFISLIATVIAFLPYMTDARFKALLTGGDYGFMIFIFAECLFILWFARLMLRSAKPGDTGDHFS